MLTVPSHLLLLVPRNVRQEDFLHVSRTKVRMTGLQFPELAFQPFLKMGENIYHLLVVTDLSPQIPVS